VSTLLAGTASANLLACLNDPRIAFAMLFQSLFELCLSANAVFAKQGAKCRYVERQLCTSGFQLAFAGSDASNDERRLQDSTCCHFIKTPPGCSIDLARR
jgi:hypothetical protein